MQRRINGGDFYVITAIRTVITDVSILAIPVWILAGLKI